MNQNFQLISLNEIKTQSNTRKTFNDKSLAELSKSIKENGVLQPILLRRNGKGYIVVAGERRFRASKLAGKVTIPAVITDETDQNKILQMQIVENLQRENLPYMEEARAIIALRDEAALDLSEICQKLGKSEAYIYQQIKLCSMPKEAQEAAESGLFTKGVAWLIAGIPNVENQIQAAKDLSRKDKSKLISLNTAKKYVSDTFGENRTSKPRRNFAQKTHGNDYQANWKKHLVNFSCDQFEHWKRILRGRTDTTSLSEAVDMVMRKSE